jgi:hypothetical protein
MHGFYGLQNKLATLVADRSYDVPCGSMDYMRFVAEFLYPFQHLVPLLFCGSSFHDDDHYLFPFRVPKRKRPEDIPPALINFCVHKTEKAGGGYLLSTHGIGILDLMQLSFEHTFTPGRRPKIKAAPKVKGNKVKIAAGYHVAYIG